MSLLESINGLTTDKRKDLLDEYKGGWAIIRQEHQYPRPTKNHIVSFHKTFEDVPFETLDRDHVVTPVSDTLYHNPSIKWDKFL